MGNATYLPNEQLVAAALEELAQQCADQLSKLDSQADQGDPDVKAERSFWKTQYNAFKRALVYWLQGLRPLHTPSGAWLVPSGSQAGAVSYLVERHGGVWACDGTCPAQRYHWHLALMAGLERADELAELHDDPPPPPAPLGARLAAARRAMAELY